MLAQMTVFKGVDVASQTWRRPDRCWRETLAMHAWTFASGKGGTTEVSHEKGISAWTPRLTSSDQLLRDTFGTSTDSRDLVDGGERRMSYRA